VVFISQPEGYVVPGRELEVWRLNKGIYGICQASPIWNKTLHVALIDYGLVQSTVDPCVYYHITLTSYLIIAVWVDDGLVAGSSTLLLDAIVTYLSQKFKITKVPADLFVSIVITRNQARRQLYLSIPQFVDKILTKFQLYSAPSLSLPELTGSPRLSTFASPSTSVDLQAMAVLPFREVVGCIMYAVFTVRFYIAFMAGKMAQHRQNSSMEHWNAAKPVLRYLKATRNRGKCFS
jgi:hypothetical protein